MYNCNELLKTIDGLELLLSIMEEEGNISVLEACDLAEYFLTID